MAVNYNPTVVLDSLSFFIDPANQKSYPGSGTTINKMINTTGSATASMLNGVTYSTANKGIMTYNGSNQYVLSNNRELGATMYPFSVGGWFKLGALPGLSQCLVSCLNAGSSSVYWAIGVNNTNEFFISRRNTTAVSNPITFLPAIGQWFNFHVNFPGNTTAKIYIDGELHTDFTSLTAVTSSTGANDVLIGLLRTSSPTWYLNGSSGPVMIYNKSLTDLEVKQNFDAIRGRYGI
jgi:hypothetical protein